MKKTIAAIFLSGVVSMAFSQSDDNISLDLYGTLRVDAYFDTYKGDDLGQDIFYLLPNYTLYNGLDVNRQKSSNISAIGSRFGAKIKGPQFFIAKSSGVIEFDFCGNLTSASSLLRLRQAYTLLTWDKGSFLIGQTWHPFIADEAQPVVAGMNSGAPFHAYNFSPMVRYNVFIGGLTLGLSMVAENQFSTRAADFSSYLNSDNHAKRNGTIPELVVTGDFNINNLFYFGAGAEYKRIKPREFVVNEAGVYSKTNEFLASTAVVAYFQYKNQLLTAMAKTFYGENMTHLLLPGGYGVASFDVTTGKETYTCFKSFTTVLNAVYGKELQFGLFAGFGKNLGTPVPLYDSGNGVAKTYGYCTNLRDMMRIAPHVAYNSGKYRFVAEFEQTMASYGQGKINLETGLFYSAHTANNSRLIFTITHTF